MVSEIIAVEISDVAFAANERLLNLHHVDSFVKFLAYVILFVQKSMLLLDEVFIYVGSAVKGIPNAAKFSERAEVGPLKLIDIVMKEVATLDKVRSTGLDGQLYFTEYGIVELDIHQNVVGPLLQTIFDPNYFKL